MFNWILSNTLQYLESFNFVDLSYIEFLEKELFDHLTVCINFFFFYKLYIYYICKKKIWH